MMLKKLITFQSPARSLPIFFKSQFHSLIPQAYNLKILPKLQNKEISYNEENYGSIPSICPQSIIIENIYECRNKRHEQARRKRLKRKNGTKNKVRWT